MVTSTAIKASLAHPRSSDQAFGQNPQNETTGQQGRSLTGSSAGPWPGQSCWPTTKNRAGCLLLAEEPHGDAGGANAPEHIQAENRSCGSLEAGSYVTVN